MYQKIVFKMMASFPKDHWVNSLAPGKCGSNFKSVILEHMLWIKFMSIDPGECHGIPLKLSQHWFR